MIINQLMKQKYADIYKNRIDELFSKYQGNPDIVSEEFEQTADFEEVVGYYCTNHPDNGLEVWLANIKGLTLTHQDDKVTKILRQIYTEEKGA